MPSKLSRKSIQAKRDGGSGPVAILPHLVLNSEAFKALSGTAVRLLIDITMQYNTCNNGALLCSWRHMRKRRGWTSSSMLHSAKKELIEHKLIEMTVQGRLPNKASWYGITWAALDQLKGLEISAQAWPRGAYAHWKPPEKTKPKRKPPIFNKALSPVQRTDT
jgi:hypothetical protein